MNGLVQSGVDNIGTSVSRLFNMEVALSHLLFHDLVGHTLLDELS